MKQLLSIALSLFTFLCLAQHPVIVDSMGNVTIGQPTASFPYNPLKVQKFQSQFEGPLINAIVATNGEAVNDVAISGTSVPVDGRGIGGRFIGGFRGVRGEVVANASAQYEGVSGLVSGSGLGSKYGVFGASIGVTGGTGVHGQAGGAGAFNYGVDGWAYGDNINYGVYGRATGGTTNWAGFFEGDTHVKDNLSIGTMDQDRPLKVVKHQDDFSGSLIHAEVQGTQQVDDIAIKGISAPAPGYGIGGFFKGGSIGVETEVISSGFGNSYGILSNASGAEGKNSGVLGIAHDGYNSTGIEGFASGGEFFNYGLHGSSNGSEGSCYGSYGVAYGQNENFGSYGMAQDAPQNYGVYGNAQGGDENYGVYGLSANADAANYAVYGYATGGTTNFGGYFVGDGYFSNRLGIGTDTPADLIHLKALNATIRVENTSGYYGRITINSGNEFNLSNSGPYPIRFISNNLEHMRITGTGEIGINTTDAADAQVHISGPDNNGTNAVLRLTSGGQHLLLDGNEIDAFGFGMYLNNNSTEDLVMVKGGGRIGINETAPEAMLHIKEQGNNERAIKIENDTDDHSWSMTMNNDNLTFYFGETQKARIESLNGAWSPLSDRRVKKDIEYLENGFLEKIKKLQPATYRYIDNPDDAMKSLGFIAQEAQEIFPELIEKNNDELMTLNYDLFTVLSVKAIQELSFENDQLKERMSRIEKKLIDQQQMISQFKDLLLELSAQKEERK